MVKADRKPVPAPSGAASPIPPLVAAFAARRPTRAGSLIVTVFGDALEPRGGGVLLSGLIDLLRHFGVNDSQVRTALSRLVSGGWFDGTRLGRRSYYRLTEHGHRRFEDATRRIYFGPERSWRGEWTLIALAATPAERREDLRRALIWLGFGALAPGVLLHPSPDRLSLASLLDDIPPGERPLAMAGTPFAEMMPERARALVTACWDFDDLALSYRAFIDAFAPIGEAFRRGWRPEPLEALLARIMLINDYRRIILRDPKLPTELLQTRWVGHEAYHLARDIYRRVAGPAESWIDRNLSGASGPLKEPNTAFHSRFAEPI